VGDESLDERDVETPTPTPPSSAPQSPNRTVASLPLPSASSPLPLPPFASSSSNPSTAKPSRKKAAGNAPCPRHRQTAHVKSGNKLRQKRKREAEQALTSTAVKKASLRHRRNSNPIVPIYDYRIRTDAPVTKPGWVARNLSFEKELLDIETLAGLDYGMVAVPWDGKLFVFLLLVFVGLINPCSAVRPIIDDEDRVIVILGGSPRDAGWKELAVDAANTMEDTRVELDESGVLQEKQRSHRRGEFIACAIGNSHGGGRKVRLHSMPSFSVH